MNPIERLCSHLKQELSWEIYENLDGLKEKVGAFLEEVSFIRNSIYSNSCRSRKFFTPPQPSPRVRGGSNKFTNDLGLLYSNSCRSRKFFTPPQPSPRVRGGSNKFINDLGWVYNRMGLYFISPGYCCITLENWY